MLNKFLLIKDGNIKFDNIINNNVKIKDLIAFLKEKKLNRIENVEALYGFTNKFMLIKKTSRPISLIINGRLMSISLLRIHKNIKWVMKILEDNNLDIRNILCAIYIDRKLYIFKR